MSNCRNVENFGIVVVLLWHDVHSACPWGAGCLLRGLRSLFVQITDVAFETRISTSLCELFEQRWYILSKRLSRLVGVLNRLQALPAYAYVVIFLC
ncbi:hypothetical protein PF010_g29528 [Phytophthora fragariae]|uniref:Secreted protein n=1 Tax=Phytophthora fragariae TaxID=53985 RepID=A0A6A3GP48_9STRA|nr:hypothetical protein PF011_g30611 [Phytophthora fragariae]KAE9062134.1 hypothetical protein PF010_g29528 [Phytophthora fragariae]